MKVVNGIENFDTGTPTCITVGTFDGLHIGHRKIIETLKRTSKSKNLKSVVITFAPHPRQVLIPGVKVHFLLTQQEKQEMIASQGIDYLVIHPFSKEFAALTAHDFLVGKLCQYVGMQHLIKGFNNHFGCDRLSDIESMRTMGKTVGFDVTEVDAQTNGETNVSSTLARMYISDGHIEQANQILGYHYFISGKVVHGRMIGRTIGFPTANIDIGNTNKLLPAPGAYAAYVDINNHTMPAMMNIGSNPTVNNDDSVTYIEVHIIGFEGNIYGCNLRTHLIRRLRPELKFDNIDQLRRRLSIDVSDALAIFQQSFVQNC
jgi:riboflavin kinase/FMN adenylyltransferase